MFTKAKISTERKSLKYEVLLLDFCGSSTAPNTTEVHWTYHSLLVTTLIIP